MRKKSFGISIALVSVTFITCSIVEKKINNEIFSPNGNFRIIELSVGGGTATERLHKIFLLNKNNKLRKDSIPILITVEGNILNISWINELDVLIKVKSKSLIQYQVVKYHRFNIIVETG